MQRRAVRRLLAGIATASTVVVVVSCASEGPPEVVVTAPLDEARTPITLEPRSTSPAALELSFTPVGPTAAGLVDLERAPARGLYAVYRDGVIRLMSKDGQESSDALRLDDVIDTDLEQGLLAVAVNPAGTHAYINYTATEREGVNSGDSIVVEYRLAPSGAFETSTARTVLVVPQPSDKHNAHELVFGPDGYLYIGSGDGSFANDPARRGLDRSSLLGKILRIDPAADAPSIVPPDNPFVGDRRSRGEIWAYGLRNPWRFTFDEQTGDLWISDVGQSGNEEIDVARSKAGLNAGKGVSFGWSAFEGNRRFNSDQPATGHRAPMHTYHHDHGRCAVVGAAVYRGSRIAALDGAFVFGDFCSGEIWAMDTAEHGSAVQLGVVPQASAVREIDGELYVLSLSDGLFRVDPT